MYLKRALLIGLLGALPLAALWAQDSETEQRIRPLVEAEVFLGKVVPNYIDYYPKTTVHTGVALNVGQHWLDTRSAVTRFFRQPRIGFQLRADHFGSPEVFGYAISAMPTLEIPTLTWHGKPIGVRMGLGLARFSTFYHPVSNRENIAIGSRYTAAFQLHARYTVWQGEHGQLRAGVGFLHFSNAHTRLPNAGLNSGLASIAWVWQGRGRVVQTDSSVLGTRPRRAVGLRAGWGWHAFGGTLGPTDAPVAAVYSGAAAASWYPRSYFRFSVGLGYRYYEHYHRYVSEHPELNPARTARLAASNIWAYLGYEFLLHHVGLNIETGINLYKPFYAQFNQLFEQNQGAYYWIKRLFPTRMGLNFYLLDQARHPAQNLYLSWMVNANFGEADFHDISLGWVRSF